MTCSRELIQRGNAASGGQLGPFCNNQIGIVFGQLSWFSAAVTRSLVTDENICGQRNHRDLFILTTHYQSVYLKQIRRNGCTIIRPELEGFRRPNWAQIEADLCVSNVGRYLWGIWLGLS